MRVIFKLSTPAFELHLPEGTIADRSRQSSHDIAYQPRVGIQSNRIYRVIVGLQIEAVGDRVSMRRAWLAVGNACFLSHFTRRQGVQPCTAGGRSL